MLNHVVVSTTPAAIRVGEVAYVSAVADEAFAASKTYVVGNTDADAIIADLAKDYATVNVTYTDEEGGNTPADATITWVADKSFDAEKAGEYKFVGNVTAPEGINYTGAAVTVEATITITGTENAGEYVISAEAEIDEIAIYKESGDNESKMTSESEALTKAAKGQTTFLVNFSLFGEGTLSITASNNSGTPSPVLPEQQIISS